MTESLVARSPWAFPVTTSYPYAAQRLADYLFTKRGYTPERVLGAVYVNTDNLDEMVDAFDDRLRSHRSRFAVKYPVEKDQSDFSAGITKMVNAGVDTVWFHVDPTIITKFTSQARLLRFDPRYVFTAPVGGDLYATAAGGNLDGAFGLASFADPQWAGAAPFRDTYARYHSGEQPDEFAVLTYVLAKTFTEGLRRAGRDLGRDAFARAMAAVDVFDTGVSSPVSFTSRSRVKSANSTMAVYEVRGTRTDQTTGFDF